MKIKDVEFIKSTQGHSDILWTNRNDFGIISILDRLTGWGEGNIRDIETGYRSKDNKFWLASGNFDIRNYPDMSIEEAIHEIKNNANTCIGIYNENN